MSVGITAFFTTLLFFFSASAVNAAELAATPSSTEITEDENLSVEFQISSEGLMGGIDAPQYEAHDFDEINTYERSTNVQSSYINGQVSVKSVQSIIVVFHPKKSGTLAIKNIRVRASGKTVTAPDITVTVHPAGTRLGNRGGGGAGYPSRSQLPSGGTHAPSKATAGSFFIRTEPNKLKVYKGEQVILTYALYTRANLLNIQVERYPNLSGFLKEDIDIPLLRGRLDYAPAVVNGHEYRRAVLAQFALFPLKDGSLPLDVLTGKFTYQVGSRMSDEDDPFAMLNQFLQATRTQSDSRTSDRVTLEVMPLPGAGQPANFSNLVGDFDISAAVDKYTVKAGEPITLKVKVDGTGHAGSIDKLNIAWPADFELYEDKSNTQYMKTGRSERIFEYMIVPKVKGKYELPSIEISMFNPATKQYHSRKTEPIQVEVLEGTPGNIYVAKTKPGATNDSGVKTTEDIRFWMSSEPETSRAGLWRSVGRGVAAGSMVLAALSLISLASGGATQAAQQEQLKRLQEMRNRVRELPQLKAEPAVVLGEVEALLGEWLEARYGINIGSLTRPEVKRALLDQARWSEPEARRVEQLLELCENQRYVPGGGDQTSATRAANELVSILQSKETIA